MMPRRPESLLDTRLYALINRLGETKQRTAAALAKLGLHMGQDMLLAQLWRTDGLPQHHLAAQLCVSAANVTQMLRGMEKQGLVRRSRDAEDGRIQRVWLTEAGVALRDPVTRIWHDRETEFFAVPDPRIQESMPPAA